MGEAVTRGAGPGTPLPMHPEKESDLPHFTDEERRDKESLGIGEGKRPTFK